MSKKSKLPKVGYSVTANLPYFSMFIMGIPAVIEDEQMMKPFKAVVTRVKHGRGKNKGMHTLTIQNSTSSL